MIESTPNNAMLSAEQLRQKAIRHADKQGRITALKRMVWRYVAWISWSWVLPIFGSLVLIFLVFMMLYHGPNVTYNGFLYWVSVSKANSIVLVEKKDVGPNSDVQEIKILRVDHSLSDFSLGLLKEEESQSQEESINIEKQSNDAIEKQTVAAAAVSSKAVSIINTQESVKVKPNTAVKSIVPKDKKIEKIKEKLNKKDSVDQKNTKATSTIKEKNK